MVSKVFPPLHVYQVQFIKFQWHYVSGKPLIQKSVKFYIILQVSYICTYIHIFQFKNVFEDFMMPAFCWWCILNEKKERKLKDTTAIFDFAWYVCYFSSTDGCLRNTESKKSLNRKIYQKCLKQNVEYTCITMMLIFKILTQLDFRL